VQWDLGHAGVRWPWAPVSLPGRSPGCWGAPTGPSNLLLPSLPALRRGLGAPGRAPALPCGTRRRWHRLARTLGPARCLRGFISLFARRCNCCDLLCGFCWVFPKCTSVNSLGQRGEWLRGSRSWGQLRVFPQDVLTNGLTQLLRKPRLFFGPSEAAPEERTGEASARAAAARGRPCPCSSPGFKPCNFCFCASPTELCVSEVTDVLGFCGSALFIHVLRAAA